MCLGENYRENYLLEKILRTCKSNFNKVKFIQRCFKAILMPIREIKVYFSEFILFMLCYVYETKIIELSLIWSIRNLTLSFTHKVKQIKKNSTKQFLLINLETEVDSKQASLTNAECGPKLGRKSPKTTSTECYLLAAVAGDKEPAVMSWPYRKLLLLALLIFLILLLNQLRPLARPLPCSLALPLPLSASLPLPELVPRGSSIWLVETSGGDLGALELCCLESVARHHPNTTVYLVLTSPVVAPASPLLPLVAAYPSVRPTYLDLDTLLGSSPLAELWRSGGVHASSYPVSHLSDLVRFLLLHRFGGVYLDTDTDTAQVRWCVPGHRLSGAETSS